MEAVLQALGMVGFIFLFVIGLLSGLIASALQGGRNKARNVIIGVVGALILPFLVALLATGVLAAGGVALILFLALIGAVVVLLIAEMISR